MDAALRLETEAAVKNAVKFNTETIQRCSALLVKFPSEEDHTGHAVGKVFITLSLDVAVSALRWVLMRSSPLFFD